MVNAPVAAGNVVIETVVDCAPETTGFWAGARFDLLLLAAELFAGDELSRALQEGRQDLKRLAGELYAGAGFAELAGAKVHLKGTEAKTSLDEVCHRRGDSIIWIDGNRDVLVPWLRVILFSSVAWLVTQI